MRAPEAGLPARGQSDREGVSRGLVWSSDTQMMITQLHIEKKTVHSLLINMLLELGLEGYEVRSVGVQHFRQKEPPGEAAPPLLTPGRSDKGAIPGHEAGLGVS